MSALKIILAAGIYICFVVILIFYIVKFRNKTKKIDNKIGYTYKRNVYG